MIAYYKKVLSQYADFSGRARRSEFWYWQLVNFLITMGAIIIGSVLSGVTESAAPFFVAYALVMVYILGTFIPNLAVGVRRMHDTGRSGWWIIVPIASLIFALTDSEPGANKWGPNPKTGATAGAASHLVD